MFHLYEVLATLQLSAIIYEPSLSTHEKGRQQTLGRVLTAPRRSISEIRKRKADEFFRNGYLDSRLGVKLEHTASTRYVRC
jgi:hypothetical protein